MTKLETRINEIISECETEEYLLNEATEGEKEEGEEKKAEGNSNPEDGNGGEEEEHEPLRPGETTNLNNFKEFFDKTNTKLTIRKESKEPSQLFGSRDTSDHNKFKCTITNDKGGSISWNFLDSKNNTNSNSTPSIDTVMTDFGLQLESAVVGTSIQNFKRQFSYDDVEDSLVQKQYDGFRKMAKDGIKTVYPDEHQVYELIQVAKKLSKKI